MSLLASLEEQARRFDSPEKLASVIDHTLLDPGAGQDAALRVVEEASRYGFHCAMLSPYHVVRVRDAAESLGVRLCTVVGFPSGFQHGEAKAAEIRYVSGSVEEIDVVANIQAALAGEISYVEEEVAGLVEEAREAGVKVVKVIVEAPLLDDDTLASIVRAVSRAGADYVKTSTGVYTKGGDVFTVLRVHQLAAPLGLRVKAAGGIRNAVDALLALASGADRIGTSSGPRVVESYKVILGS